MKVNKREYEAIVQFLDAVHDARESRERSQAAREWLFERTRQNPTKVLLFLDSLKKGREKRDGLLRRLRLIATSALLSK